MEIISEKNVCVYIHMCICITESLCCTLETNTILQINYTSIFFFLPSRESCFLTRDWTCALSSEKCWVLTIGPLGRSWELVLNGHRVSVWEDEKVLQMDGDGGLTATWKIKKLTKRNVWTLFWTWFKPTNYKCKGHTHIFMPFLRRLGHWIFDDEIKELLL